MATANPEPVDLLIEQEAAIDKLFGEMAARISESLSRMETIDERKVMRIVDHELARMYGTSPANAADSIVGRLVRAYAHEATTRAMIPNIDAMRAGEGA